MSTLNWKGDVTVKVELPWGSPADYLETLLPPRPRNESALRLLPDDAVDPEAVITVDAELLRRWQAAEAAALAALTEYATLTEQLVEVAHAAIYAADLAEQAANQAAEVEALRREDAKLGERRFYVTNTVFSWAKGEKVVHTLDCAEIDERIRQFTSPLSRRAAEVPVTAKPHGACKARRELNRYIEWDQLVQAAKDEARAQREAKKAAAYVAIPEVTTRMVSILMSDLGWSYGYDRYLTYDRDTVGVTFSPLSAPASPDSFVARLAKLGWKATYSPGGEVVNGSLVVTRFALRKMSRQEIDQAKEAPDGR